MKLSASSLNLFLKCPYAYYLKEIEKVEPQFTEDRVFTGKLVHKTLENYFTFRKDNPDENPSLLDFLDDAYKELRDNLSNSIQTLNFKDDAVEMLKQYEATARTLQPLETEKEFELEIDDIRITGYIDLITKDRKVIDFKTTNSTNIKVSTEYKLQLSIYALTNQGNSYYLHYITPIKTQEIQVKPMKQTLLLQILNQFKNVYLGGGFTPSGITHPYACQSCAYKHRCVFFQKFIKEG